MQNKRIEIYLPDEDVRKFRISSSIFTDDERQDTIRGWRTFQREGGHKRTKQAVPVYCIPHKDPEVALKNANNPRDIKRGYNNNSIILSYVQDEYRRIGPVEGYHFVLYNLIRGHEAGRGFSPITNVQDLVSSKQFLVDYDKIIVRPHYVFMQNITELYHRLHRIGFQWAKAERQKQLPIKPFPDPDFHMRKICEFIHDLSQPFRHTIRIDQLRRIYEELQLVLKKNR